jgi:selenocysteine lyase/cysteine desulfurase
VDPLAHEGAPDEAYWDKVRAQFEFAEEMVYMNNGSLGPVSKRVLEARMGYEREYAADPRHAYRFTELDEVRAQLAEFLRADPDEIAITRSTSEGMAAFAHGLKWSEGDEVVTGSQEHLGGSGPYWTLADKFGIRVKVVDVPSPPESVEQIVDLYERAMTPRTKVLVVSHITYVSGLVMPIRELTELAHRHGALISIDGAHPLGMLPIDLHAIGCDHYAASGQKWLMAGTGTGISFINREVQQRVFAFGGASPTLRASPTVGPLLKKFDASARKYELFGQRHVPSALAIAEAVRMQTTIGSDHVEQRVRMLSTRLRRGLGEIAKVTLLTSTDPQLSAAMTLFSISEVPMASIRRVLHEREGIHITDMAIAGINAVRVSTHIYNTPDQVDRLLETVRDIAARPGVYR